MGSEKSRKPKSKYKNRLFIGDLGGITLSPKIMKTWHKAVRGAFYGGPKRNSNSNSNTRTKNK